MIWEGTARVGAAVSYECNEGYNSHSLKNTSKCEENGLWEDIELTCEGCIHLQYCAKAKVCFKKCYIQEHYTESMDPCLDTNNT